RSDRIARLGETARPRQNDGRIPLPSPTTVGGQVNTIENVPSVSQLPPAPQAPVLRAAPQTVAMRRSRPRLGAGCSTTVDPQVLQPAAALPRGWCLMNLNRPMEAAKAFEVALQNSSQQAREDAAYGQSLAYLRLGLASNAAVSAAKM